MNPIRIIRPTAAAAMLGVSRATLYRLVRAGALPAPLRISQQCTGWTEETLAAYIESRRTAEGGK